MYSVQSSKSFLVIHRHVQIIGSKQQREEIKSQIISVIENDIHVPWPRPFRKTKSYTAISLAWEGLRNWGKTQTRGKKNGRAKPSGIVWGGKRVQAFHAIFMSFHSVFRHFSTQRSLVLGYDPLGNNSSAARSKILWNVDASSN